MHPVVHAINAVSTAWRKLGNKFLLGIFIGLLRYWLYLVQIHSLTASFHLFLPFIPDGKQQSLVACAAGDADSRVRVLRPSPSAKVDIPAHPTKRIRSRLNV